MAGGLDILIVGIADENLDFVGTDEKLRELFDKRRGDEKASANKYFNDFYALVKDHTLEDPRIFYLVGEHMIGSQTGAGLGYVIFDGNLNNQPRRIEEGIFRRIDELKKSFINETTRKGLNVPHDKVGIYALNVCDT